MPTSGRFGQDSPWCFYCGNHHGNGLVDLHKDGEWLGRICPACQKAGPRKAAAKARARATQYREAATKSESLPDVQQGLRKYAALLDGLANHVESLDAWL